MFRIISNGNILQTGNAIVEAQKRSSLYDTSKLAADPLIADKKEIAKTAGKGWFDIQVRTPLDGHYCWAHCLCPIYSRNTAFEDR